MRSVAKCDSFSKRHIAGIELTSLVSRDMLKSESASLVCWLHVCPWPDPFPMLALPSWARGCRHELAENIPVEPDPIHIGGGSATS